MSSHLQARLTIAANCVGRDTDTANRIVADTIAETVTFAWSVERTANHPEIRTFALRVTDAGLAVLNAHDNGQSQEALRCIRQLSIAIAVLEGLTSA
jgi:hypothetical protein